MSSIRHGAGGNQSCMRYTISVKDVVLGTKSSNRLLSATTETRRKLESLKEFARMTRRNAQRERRRWALKEKSSFCPSSF